jgi:paraquat-inducible protein B
LAKGPYVLSDQATIKEQSSLSRVWIIPLLSVLIGIWMIYTHWANQGTLVTITLPGAAGIEANKTPIKMRDLEIGQVKKIVLSETLDGVVVTARIQKEAEHLLTETSKFWIVSPRISISEVSGLSTLLSGSFIAMSGDGQGRVQTNFIAQPRPPVTPPGTPGLHVNLTSRKDFAYKEGDPIIYKGFKVGEFEESFFNQYERSMYYTAFIEAPYHRLINENTRFWDASGIKIRLRASGLEVDTGSVETLLSNGVTFDVPEGMPGGEAVADGTYFEIYSSTEAAMAERYRLSAEYVMLIDETVRGLNVGAPVEYRGISVGEVVSINELPVESGSLLEADYKIPVVINVYPGKVLLGDTPEGLAQVRQQMTQWIQQDLRATLRIGNVLTGALYIDLNHSLSEMNGSLAYMQEYEVIPTESSEFTQITQKAEALLDKLNSLPLETLSENTIAAIDEMALAATSVKESADEFEALVNELDVETINKQLSITLANVASITDKLNQSGVETDVQSLVTELRGSLKDLQPVLQQLNQAPSSLLFYDNSTVDIEPKAAGEQ